MNTHVVTKRLPKGEGFLEVGTEVDASEWRNAPMLVSQRYLKPIDAVAEPDGQQSDMSFDERVVAAVKKAIAGGELTLSTASRASARMPQQSTNKS